MTAKANTQIDFKSLPFVQRLELVKACIVERVRQVQPSERPALRARLWCLWLSREVLA